MVPIGPPSAIEHLDLVAAPVLIIRGMQRLMQVGDQMDQELERERPLAVAR